MNRRISERNVLEFSKLPSTIEQCETTSLRYSEMGCDFAIERADIDVPANFDIFSSLRNDSHDPDLLVDCNWSDATGRTISSCSWGDDEFERESAKKVKGWLDAVDDVLYEEKVPQILNEEVLEECLDWSKKYPYLRLKGKQVTPQYDGWYFSSQNISEHSRENCDGSSLDEAQKAISGESKVGEKIALPKIYIENILTSSDHDEEIIIKNGFYEDCTSSVERHENNFSSDTSQPSHKPSPSTLDAIKECVIEKLARHFWPTVSALLRESRSKVVASKHAVLLPPIIVPVGQRRAPSRAKTQERYQNVVTPDIPQLDGILTVSSKILQKRKESRDGSAIGSRSRPGSGIPIKLRTPDNKCGSNLPNNEVTSSLISNCNNSYSIQDFLKSSMHTNSKMDTHELHMPILEEENPSFPDILHGVHIEPEVREALCKCKINDNFNILPKPSGVFLPPIADTEHISNQNLTMSSSLNIMNRNDSQFTGRNTYRSNSRPSTSMTIRSLSDFVVKRKQSTTPEKSPPPQFNGRRQKISILSNQKSSFTNSQNKIESTTNVEKSVTLFPLVTSLEPEYGPYNRKRKSVQNTKKDGFLGDSTHANNER